MTRLYIQDVTLRDGMHAIRHQYDLGHVRAIAEALDEAGVDAIEVAHGDGLTGSTFNYGFGAFTDESWISEAAKVCKRAKLTTLLLPGIGTIHDLKRARDLGFSMAEIAELVDLWRNRQRASASVKRIAQRHVDDLATRIEAMQAMQRSLQALLAHCQGDNRPDCPILDDLAGTPAPSCH